MQSLKIFIQKIAGKLAYHFRNRKKDTLICYNHIRFLLISFRSNVTMHIGKKLCLDRKFVLRTEGKECHIRIGDGVSSNGTSTIVIGGNGSLQIGKHVYMNDGVMISCLGCVTIGDDTLIGPQVNIFDNNHFFDQSGVRRECKPGNIRIGKNCWIAANVVLLDGADIGDNCVIGTGCIIKGSVPDGMIVTLHQEQHINKIR